MIKYLGSKRLLMPHIVESLAPLTGVHRVLDLFSGTARVGQALKARGLHVHANDHNAYAATLAMAYVQADGHRWLPRAARLIAELDRIDGEPGWFTDTYCVRSRFLQPQNGARVDAIRTRIAALALEPELEAIALVSLLEAADRVDSTTGLQMAYLKQWAARSHQPLRLRVPELIPGDGHATCLDALACARQAEADLAYLDPPYNQHSYLGNYHIWESLVRWDKPETYGVAMKRVDVRERPSAFNRKRSIEGAFREVLEAVSARWLLVSFNDEGHLGLDLVRTMLEAHGSLDELAIEHPRYIGHRIGVFNLRGERVGTPSKPRNHEHLFLVDRAGVGVRPAARAAIGAGAAAALAAR